MTSEVRGRQEGRAGRVCLAMLEVDQREGSESMSGDVRGQGEYDWRC